MKLQEFKEKLKKIIEEIEATEDNHLNLMSFCLDKKGIVIRTSINLNICSNELCENCRELENEIGKNLTTGTGGTPNNK